MLLWVGMPVAAFGLVWWWMAYAGERCGDCGSHVVFCTFPFRCAGRRRAVVEQHAEDEPPELPPPEEQL